MIKSEVTLQAEKREKEAFGDLKTRDNKLLQLWRAEYKRLHQELEDVKAQSQVHMNKEEHVSCSRSIHNATLKMTFSMTSP